MVPAFILVGEHLVLRVLPAIDGLPRERRVNPQIRGFFEHLEFFGVEPVGRRPTAEEQEGRSKVCLALLLFRPLLQKTAERGQPGTGANP